MLQRLLHPFRKKKNKPSNANENSSSHPELTTQQQEEEQQSYTDSIMLNNFQHHQTSNLSLPARSLINNNILNHYMEGGKSSSGIDEYFFQCAGVLGKFSNVREILDQLEKANVKDHMNRNILHHACQWGNLEIVRYGILRGIPVNLKDSLGNTPLHYCCGEGYYNIVILLLQHPKIRIDVKNKEGQTPRRKAYFHGHDDVLLLLDRYMGNINLFKERLKNQVIDVESSYSCYKLSDISIRTQQ